MASKQVTDREKSARAVVAAGETQAAAASAEIKKLLAPHLNKGESMPDVALLMTLVARALDTTKTRLVEADAAHEAELGDDEPVRRGRDEAAESLSDKLVELREIITGVYGAATTTALFPGPTPVDPVVLARFAGSVTDRLARVRLPAPRIKGAKFDTAELTETLETQRATLEQQLKDVAREVREAQATLEAKNQALMTYDAVFDGTAMTLAGLLRLAGKTELAARVKPSGRRAGQTAGDTEEPPTTPPTPTLK